MKTGKELNLEIIKCQNKTGTDSIKEIHRNINGILYPLTFKYIDQALASETYTQLCDYGKKLSELEVPKSAEPKKNEIMSELRKRCMVLKDYRKIKNTAEDAPQMQKVINFFIHQWIEQKQGELTPENVRTLLRESNRIYKAFKPFAEHLKVDTLIKSNEEMLNYFSTTFSLE